MTKTSAEASIEVAVDPETAFRVFTEEIDLWWARGPINAYDASRLDEIRLEPGVGGRMLEIYDEASGDMLETSRVTVWEPGVRLVLRGVVNDTEAVIRFDKADAGTRISVSQYLVEGGDPRTVGFGWVNMLVAYGGWTGRRDTAPRRPRELDRLGLALYYRDPAAACRWLHDVFQLGSWEIDRAPELNTNHGWIELHIGNAILMMFTLDGERPADAPTTHNTWVHVDDLEAHYDHAKEHGATIVSEIRLHGSRNYVAEDIEGYRWTFLQARPTMR